MNAIGEMSNIEQVISLYTGLFSSEQNEIAKDIQPP